MLEFGALPTPKPVKPPLLARWNGLGSNPLTFFILGVLINFAALALLVFLSCSCLFDWSELSKGVTKRSCFLRSFIMDAPILLELAEKKPIYLLWLWWDAFSFTFVLWSWLLILTSALEDRLWAAFWNSLTAWPYQGCIIKLTWDGTPRNWLV